MGFVPHAMNLAISSTLNLVIRGNDGGGMERTSETGPTVRLSVIYKNIEREIYNMWVFV
jgi:hypothetical protein